MEKLLALTLAGLCGTVSAQTPATNLMPDGSHDMYIGLGAVSAPAYEGARERRRSALPVLQMEWSNGIFVSGLSAGMHLSRQPSMEFGPLLAVQRGRSESGSSRAVGGVEAGSGEFDLAPPDPGLEAKQAQADVGRLSGMNDIDRRLEAGGFFNYYLTPQLRLTNNLLAGSGKERNGARWNLGVQYIVRPGAHHSLSLAAGLTLVNRHYNETYFGVTPEEEMSSGNRAYAPSGGLKDVLLGARWNFAFAPAWILTSALQFARLQASAKDSPLVERPSSLTVSTALAYRF